MSEGLGDLLRGERNNAGLGYAIVTLLVLAAGVSLYRGDLTWTLFAVVVLSLVLLPPVALRDWRAMIPWEVTLVAALPVLGRAFATLPVTGAVATYLSVAAIALIVAVELHLFSPVRMSERFAAGFVAIATLGTAGLWAVGRWLLDQAFGTGLLLAPGVPVDTVERALMLEFVASTIAGVLAGVLFVLFVRHRVDHESRYPEEMAR